MRFGDNERGVPGSETGDAVVAEPEAEDPMKKQIIIPMKKQTIIPMKKQTIMKIR